MEARIRFSEDYLFDYLRAISLEKIGSDRIVMEAATRLSEFIAQQVKAYNHIDAAVGLVPTSDTTPDLSIQYNAGTAARFDRALMEVTVRGILMNVELVRAALGEGEETWDEYVYG